MSTELNNSLAFNKGRDGEHRRNDSLMQQINKISKEAVSEVADKE
jgi:hypothetical protein